MNNTVTPDLTHKNARHQGMMKTMLRNITCWLEIMHLDPLTGGDPPGVKLRAMQARVCACAWCIPATYFGCDPIGTHGGYELTTRFASQPLKHNTCYLLSHRATMG